MNEIIRKGEVKAKLWKPIEKIEQSALQQIYAMTEHPLLHKWLSIMPDVHAGIGATIGSVIPLQEGIIPSAVGVDIGCFTGETKVICLDGKDWSFKQLVEEGKEIFVYAVDNEGEITAAKATARKTRTNAPLIRVHLDSGEHIDCTPDHQFRLLDGNYKKAEDLLPSDSLTPLYKSYDKDGYLRIQLLKRKWAKKAHWMVAHAGLIGKIPAIEGQRTIVHHRDFDKQNNAPDNLEFMGNKDHSSFHQSLITDRSYWNSPEFQKKRLEGMQKYWDSPEGQQAMAKVGAANFREYMEKRPEHFKESVKDNGKRGGKYLSSYNVSEKGRAKSREVSNRQFECEICGEKGKSGFFLHNHRRKVHKTNHKIVKIEKLSTTEDVYCLTVPEYHNFALAAGVFVHNCGMCSVKTNLPVSVLDERKQEIHDDIIANIPRGFSHRAQGQLEAVTDFTPKVFLTHLAEYQKTSDKALIPQLGTLGGGNHFIELQRDAEGNVWIMLHSGSRNIGNALAVSHIRVSKNYTAKAKLQVAKDLDFLIEGTPEFDAYVKDMNFAMDFAKWNRHVMMECIKKVIKETFPGVEFTEIANIHHNYAAKERHFGQDVWVHRKGATHVTSSVTGIIPGSMGTPSYIVKGTDEQNSYKSCSHGAGRTMSRSGAKKTITLETFREQMKDIFTTSVDTSHLDEAPDAYNDIDEVMDNQTDLVTIQNKLTPVLNIKG